MELLGVATLKILSSVESKLGLQARANGASAASVQPSPTGDTWAGSGGFVSAPAGAGVPTPGTALPADAPAPSENAPAASPSSNGTAPSAPLTAEEQSLLQQGFLPPSYGELKLLGQTKGVDAAKAAYRAGKKGPFQPGYGDPAQMLSGARKLAKNPELARLFTDLKVGDVLAVAYNSSGDIIANATHGPFAHVLVCTQAGVPPEFIEAIGMTGDQKDPSNNQVRRNWAYDVLGNGPSYRRLSPASGPSATLQSVAIAKAVQYCEHSLGKPYDYTFGENGVGRSFYCSSLAYDAYTQGAGLSWQLPKQANRDTLMLALDSMVDALAPKDRAALMDEAARTLNGRPKPTTDQLVHFMVERVLPSCNATAAIAKTPKEQQQLAAVIDRFRQGKGLPRYQAASDKMDADAKAGKFKTPVIGALRKLWDRTRIGADVASDLFHAYDGSGMSRFATIRAATRLAYGFLPYSEAVSAFIFGKKDGRTHFFGKILNTTGWLRTHRPFSWVCGWLPVRGTNAIDGNFVSPTDVAWSPMAHSDYNVRAGESLDAKR